MSVPWGGAVTLQTVVAHAAELLHPKSTAANYPALADHPNLKRLAAAVIQAQQTGEPVSVVQEAALALVAYMRVIREGQQANWRGKATTGKAQDVLSKPKAIRDRDNELKTLRKKVVQAAKAQARAAPPMPDLFGALAVPEPPPPPAPAPLPPPAPFHPRRP